MDPNDLAYALACAAEISGLPWDGSIPPTKFIDRDYMGSVSPDVDRNGNAVQSNRLTGAYINGKAYFSNRASEPTMAHEMTHYLQDRNGLGMGRADREGNALATRREREAQAYNVEELTPYECLALFGGWNSDVKSAADRKRAALVDALTQSKGAKPPETE